MTSSSPTLQASRAALSDSQLQHDATGNGDSLEPGEISEVDMQAQAEGIRTVFNDPTHFNVKASTIYTTTLKKNDASPLCSIRSTLRGLSGSIHRQPRAEIYHKRPSLPFHQHHFLRPPVLPPRRGGWRISSASSVLIV